MAIPTTKRCPNRCRPADHPHEAIHEQRVESGEEERGCVLEHAGCRRHSEIREGTGTSAVDLIAQALERAFGCFPRFCDKDVQALSVHASEVGTLTLARVCAELRDQVPLRSREADPVVVGDDAGRSEQVEVLRLDRAEPPRVHCFVVSSRHPPMTTITGSRKTAIMRTPYRTVTRRAPPEMPPAR